MDIDQKYRQALPHALTKPSVKWSIFLISIFLLFTVVGPNLEWLKSPVTPAIKGIVTDADTNMPIRDMQILITHEISYSYMPGNGYVDYHHALIVTTDTNGNFTSNRAIKPLSLSLFGLYNRDYYGSYVTTLTNKYHYVSKKIRTDGHTQILVHKLNNQHAIADNIKVYSLLAGDNYPRNVKDVVVKYKLEADKLFVDTQKNIYRGVK